MTGLPRRVRCLTVRLTPTGPHQTPRRVTLVTTNDIGVSAGVRPRSRVVIHRGPTHIASLVVNPFS